MKRLVWPLLCFTLFTSAAESSEDISVPIEPPGSHLGATVFALGIVPIAAGFSDFTGTVAIDRGKPASCAVQLTVRLASLRMADPGLNRLALGPAVLDASHFPVMRYVGHCKGSSLVGMLTLHGQTHPFIFTIARHGAEATASGMLRRRDFGIGGLGGLIAQAVRFRLDAALPAAVQAIAPR